MIIVLAFVLLLSGIIVAFFSRALSDRNISNSSASQTKTEIFAQGAADSIIADLQQEIVAGSTATPTTGGSVYYPKPTTGAKLSTAMPAYQGFDPHFVGGIEDDGLNNLVKRSASGKKFFDKGINANFDSDGKARASAVSTSTASLNGRSISSSRWNKPLFMLSKSTNAAIDLTPADTVLFTAPDWIFVARDGSNPTVFSNDMVTSPTAGPNSKAATVVGRYAYNIYDEGSLLDMNVAGYPYPPAGASDIAKAKAASKSALAYADLTQLTNAAGQALFTATQISHLVSWRNFATLTMNTTVNPPVVGPVPNSLSSGINTWSDSQILSYSNYVGSNPGFMRINSSNVVGGTPGQSDKAFSSRQQLISFITQRIGADPTKARTAMQYLTHFSRDIDQPSYARAQSVDPNAPGYDATAPKVLQDGTLGFGGNDGYKDQANTNPAFLMVRVSTSFARNDGSNAAVGEPLVASRFALSRLSWITYLGPSGENLTDSKGVVMKAALVKQGVSDQMLKRGTKDNIYKYFGILWDSSKHRWVYDHTSVATPGSPPTLPNLAGIRTLSNITGREPDFFELLKASIQAGSLGKHGSLGKDAPPTQPVRENTMVQYVRDIQIDMQIYNIGLNIIDQADPDNYPTRMIVYNNDPSNAPSNTPSYRELYGVENLPYFHRFRNGVVRIKEASNTNQPKSVGDNGNIDKTGVAALLLYPEIWNPHASNSSVTGIDPTTGVSFSSLGPTNFQVTANSIDPDKHSASDQSIQLSQNLTTDSLRILPTDVPTPTLYVPPTLENSVLQFQIPSGPLYSALFREPTVLIKPNFPSGSNLKAIWPDSTYVAGGGFTASITPGTKLDPSVPARANQIYYAGSLTATGPYLGILLGRAPLQYFRQSGGYFATQALQLRYTSGSCMALTMHLQYQDAWNNWVTYNEVFPPMLMQIGVNYLVDDNNGTYITETFDPRTSRFGMFQHQGNNPAATIDANGISTTNRTYPFAGGDAGRGFTSAFGYGLPQTPGATLPAPGWFGSDDKGWTASQVFISTLCSQNDASLNGPTGRAFYADPDGVVRRATGAWMPDAVSSVGNPMKTFNDQSRPIILNRPFRSVPELGYVFRDEPWKELDFFTPESGDAALLDTFCINESSNTNHLVAGRVNVNTRQQLVLNAIVSGSYKDELKSQAVSGALDPLSNVETGKISSAFAAWTATTPASDLPGVIGKWSKPVRLDQAVVGNKDNTGLGYGIKGKDSYSGFTNQLTSAAFATSPVPSWNIQRFHSSVTRGILANGQTRIWNLMVDLIAQTGRYPSSASKLENFAVEGEQRFWVHLAIDRLTGKVLDQQVEVVKE